jgi:hypothetical protein
MNASEEFENIDSQAVRHKVGDRVSKKKGLHTSANCAMDPRD